MSRVAFCSLTALALVTSVALAQAPSMGQEQQKAPQDRPQGQTSAPDHTIPPPPQAQPKAPIADQSKPAAVGPAQANTASNVSNGAKVGPPGATGQTMPSTISADNAKLDKLPTTALQFPLTDEQKKLIAKSVASAPKSTDAGLANLHVADFLPAPNPPVQDFSLEVMSEIPAAKQYRFVRLDKRLLVVDPSIGTVVGEISE
ncbi:MAG: hypothetical protein WCE79_00870 [Xanthobacteraceae bacterium]